MTLILDVQPGSIVYLDCGCLGYRMRQPLEGPVLVIVERPCESHVRDGSPQLRYLNPLEGVTPFTQARDQEDRGL